MRTHWLVLVLAALTVLGAAVVAAAGEAPSVEVHGWSLTRYYVNTTVDATLDSQGRITSEEDDSFLAEERISLSGIARLADGKQVYAEFYVHPWLPQSDPSYLYLESLYVDLPTSDGAKVRIGKGRNVAFGIVPAYGNRKTSNYSPLAETFTMDRVIGVQYLKKLGTNDFAFALQGSQRVGSRYIGMAADGQIDRGTPPAGTLGTTTVKHLTARDNTADHSGKLEATARYGWSLGDLSLGVSGRVGALDATDTAALAKTFGAQYVTDSTRSAYGVDATYRRMPFYGTVEYYDGSTGGVDVDGFAILIGVEPTPKCTGIWREMSGACKGLFVRYVDLNVDVVPTLSSATWDVEQIAVSYVLPLKCKSLPFFKWLQFEYERNKESVPAGADEISNDVFFVELFTAF